MTEVPIWHRFECSLRARREYTNPVADLRLTAEIMDPNGVTYRREGFWDGGDTWKIRFSPNAAGEWKLVTRSHPIDAGLDGRSESFVCIENRSLNALYRHGRVGVRKGERILRHADGTPFFWLGDTAWNGVLKSQQAGWSDYLADRSAKGFNVIQFVTTQWMAAAGNADARLAYIGQAPIQIDPEFFRWMDERVSELNDHGFLGAPVIAWAATWNRQALQLSPGTGLPDDDIVRLGRYLLARYGAHHMAWILAGDGHYTGEEANRWRRIGRSIFADNPALATIHPGGHLWLEDEFRDEPWFSFHGYQSGHWRGSEAIRWIRSGPASTAWQGLPSLPQINLEFCYEAHEDFETHRAFDAFDVREHAYLSLLATPPAGLTYGCQGVWSWESAPRLPMGHPKTGLAMPWRQAIQLEGSTSMKYLREIFESLAWWRLRPAPELILDDGLSSAAMSPERDVAIVYSSARQRPVIHRSLLLPGLLEREIDPATGASPGPATRDLAVVFSRAG